MGRSALCGRWESLVAGPRLVRSCAQTLSHTLISEVKLEIVRVVGVGSPQVQSGGAGSQLRGRKVLGMLRIRVGASRVVEFQLCQVFRFLVGKQGCSLKAPQALCSQRQLGRVTQCGCIPTWPEWPECCLYHFSGILFWCALGAFSYRTS